MQLADTTEMTLSDALEEASSLSGPGPAVLKRWRDHGTLLWVYFAAQNGGVASVVRAQVAEVSRCLVLKNDAAVLRFDLARARFRYGPLQAIFAPTALGRAAVLTSKPEGLVGEDGLIVALESGHTLFLRESPVDASDWPSFVAALDRGLDRLLGP